MAEIVGGEGRVDRKIFYFLFNFFENLKLLKKSLLKKFKKIYYF